MLPSIGHALAFINELEHADMVGINPEVGHEQMASLNYTHGIAQALWAGKLFHIDLNGQKGPRLRPGPGLRPRRPAASLLHGRPARERRTRRRADLRRADRHFDYKPLRTENMDGVWESARANMELYLMLRDRARAFRADPEVQEALEAARVGELSSPTLSDGETYQQLLADPTRVRGLRPRAGPYPGLRLRPPPAPRRWNISWASAEISGRVLPRVRGRIRPSISPRP